MKIVVEYQGSRYVSPCADGSSAEEAGDALYNVIDKMDKLQLSLVGGGVLILGKLALQSAVIMVLPDDPEPPEPLMPDHDGGRG